MVVYEHRDGNTLLRVVQRGDRFEFQSWNSDGSHFAEKFAEMHEQLQEARQEWRELVDGYSSPNLDPALSAWNALDKLLGGGS